MLHWHGIDHLALPSIGGMCCMCYGSYAVDDSELSCVQTMIQIYVVHPNHCATQMKIHIACEQLTIHSIR